MDCTSTQLDGRRGQGSVLVRTVRCVIIAGGLAVGALATGGCAKNLSTGWAQNSPLIRGESSTATTIDDRDVSLGGVRGG